MPITLSSRFARRTALVGAAATLSIALAACSASFNAPTLQPYQPAEGTNVDTDSLHVRNMLVLANADGKGELHSVIVNNGSEDDTLVKIEQAPAGAQDGQAGGEQPASGSVTFSELKPALDLKAGTATILPGSGASSTGQSPAATPSPTPTETPGATPSPGETPGAEAPGPAITVTGAKPGQMVNVTITFGKAAPITTYIPVLTDDHFSPSPNASQ